MFQYNFSGIIYFMLFTMFYVENFIIKLIFSRIFLPMNSHKFHWIFVFAPHTFSWNLNVVKKLVILRFCKGVWCTAIITLCDTFEFFFEVGRGSGSAWFLFLFSGVMRMGCFIYMKYFWLWSHVDNFSMYIIKLDVNRI